MEKQIKIAYLIKDGDNLNELAQYFGTTIEEVLKENKHINKDFLHKDDIIVITPGAYTKKTKTTQIEFGEQSAKMTDLCNLMYRRFGELFFWTYSYIVSKLEGSNDITYVQDRLVKVPEELTNIFLPYYPQEYVKDLENLFRDHILIITRLIGALERNSPVQYERYNSDLYNNADDIVKKFVQLNPMLNEDLLQDMFYIYLDNIKGIIIARNNQTFVQEIERIDLARNQIIKIANYIAEGLREQFPDRL